MRIFINFFYLILFPALLKLVADKASKASN